MDNKETKTVVPKYLPVKCVVCNGWGTVRHGELTCGACQGSGYILVEAKEVEDNDRP